MLIFIFSCLGLLESCKETTVQNSESLGTLLLPQQLTEIKRTGTTEGAAPGVGAETGTGREGAGTERDEEAETIMGTARTEDTGRGMRLHCGLLVLILDHGL